MYERVAAACFLGATLAMSAAPASAGILLSDSLQGSLNNWHNPSNTVSVVPAPDVGKAITWSSASALDDFATKNSFVSPTGEFTLSFQTYGSCGHVIECGLLFGLGTGASTDWRLYDTNLGSGWFSQIDGGWEIISYTFAATSAQLNFRSWSGAAYSGPGSFYLRNLTLTDNSEGLPVGTLTLTALPEPGTWAMLILGFGAVGAALRRRPASQRLAA